MTSSQESKEFNPIREYNEKIVSGEIIVSDKVKRVYAKLVSDLDDPNCPWIYDEEKAKHVVIFIQKYCKHSKGKQGGKPFILELWQKALLAALFGFVDEDGNRRFRELVLIVARKNGKSALGSAIGNYMLFADGEHGAEVYSAATKREQAKIIWSEAKRMIQKSPALSKRARCLVGEIVTDFNDGTFKPLASDSNTLDGLNVHCSLIDELHAIEDKNLYDVIIDGMSARENPISVITSTAGTVREGIFDIKYEECERAILSYTDPDYRDYANDRLLPIIYELDKRDEWQDPNMWVKANPGLGTIKSIEQIAEKVHKAQVNPRLQKNLLCKDFNVRETSTEAWLTFEEILNEEKFDIAELRPSYAIGGIDLSATTDLTCATILFEKGDIPDKIFVHQMYWLPEDLLERRVEEDKIPYDVWKQMGLLRTTPGNKVDYHYIVDWFAELRDEYDIYIPWFGYDSWSATYFVQDMKNTYGEHSMEAIIQGKKTLSAPMKALGADLAAKKIVYNNNPILKWCLSNTSVDIDKNDNIQPMKGQQARKRIDGMASLLDAYVCRDRHLEEYHSII